MNTGHKDYYSLPHLGVESRVFYYRFSLLPSKRPGHS
nr:MAG TPA: hypothetical protein [Caudoviricetes sp.]